MVRVVELVVEALAGGIATLEWRSTDDGRSEEGEGESRSLKLARAQADVFEGRIFGKCN